MRSFFVFRIIGILEHAKAIRQKNKYCKNCELLKENKCKRYELCLKVLSDILDDHPSNTSKKIEKIIEYTSQIPGANIINVIYKNAPKNKPRKFIRLSKDWNKKIEIISWHEYREIANKLGLEPQSPWPEDNKKREYPEEWGFIKNYKNGKESIDKLAKKLFRLTHSTPQEVEIIANRVLWNHQKIQKTSKKIRKKHISKKPKKFMKHKPQR